MRILVLYDNDWNCTMAKYRRDPVVGDIMVFDYRDMNAFGIVRKVSESKIETGGVGDLGDPAYYVEILCGIISPDSNGHFEPLNGSFWMKDDEDNVSTQGVNGYALPAVFYGVDLADFFRKRGCEIHYA